MAELWLIFHTPEKFTDLHATTVIVLTSLEQANNLAALPQRTLLGTLSNKQSIPMDAYMKRALLLFCVRHRDTERSSLYFIPWLAFRSNVSSPHWT
jgi:hypothetical protein